MQADLPSVCQVALSSAEHVFDRDQKPRLVPEALSGITSRRSHRGSVGPCEARA
jgi:hypothetical protein